MEAFSDTLKGTCILCLDETAGLWCENCERDLFHSHVIRCPVCATTCTTNNKPCGNCLKNRPVYENARVICSYQYPINRLIKKIKFDKKPEFIFAFVNQFVHKLENNANLPEVLIPVPLHPKRQAERGFNQSAVFATKLAKKLGIRAELSLVVRSKNTRPQSSLSYKHRKKNVKAAFSLIKDINYNHVAIIDDVITTGATINELAKLLKRAGVENIDAWAIAKTNQ